MRKTTGEKLELKRVGASTYACPLCGTFMSVIVKKVNVGEKKKLLAARLAEHLSSDHS